LYFSFVKSTARIEWWIFFHICILDSQDEETDIFVAKEQRRFAHSAAEQKRRDAIRVGWCYLILWYVVCLSQHSLCTIISIARITCGMFKCLNMITYSLPSVGFHCCSEIWNINNMWQMLSNEQFWFCMI